MLCLIVPVVPKPLPAPDYIVASPAIGAWCMYKVRTGSLRLSVSRPPFIPSGSTSRARARVEPRPCWAGPRASSYVLVQFSSALSSGAIPSRFPPRSDHFTSSPLLPFPLLFFPFDALFLLFSFPLVCVICFFDLSLPLIFLLSSYTLSCRTRYSLITQVLPSLFHLPLSGRLPTSLTSILLSFRLPASFPLYPVYHTPSPVSSSLADPPSPSSCHRAFPFHSCSLLAPPFSASSTLTDPSFPPSLYPHTVPFTRLTLPCCTTLLIVPMRDTFPSPSLFPSSIRLPCPWNLTHFPSSPLRPISLPAESRLASSSSLVPPYGVHLEGFFIVALPTPFLVPICLLSVSPASRPPSSSLPAPIRTPTSHVVSPASCHVFLASLPYPAILPFTHPIPLRWCNLAMVWVCNLAVLFFAAPRSYFSLLRINHLPDVPFILSSQCVHVRRSSASALASPSPETFTFSSFDPSSPFGASMPNLLYLLAAILASHSLSCQCALGVFPLPRRSRILSPRVSQPSLTSLSRSDMCSPVSWRRFFSFLHWLGVPTPTPFEFRSFVWRLARDWDCGRPLRWCEGL
ncbi:hypothetical protein B0H19DRAFT_1263880 [Mycena capillaripes]|nr:hypothetical protein B0H19DRAFT_1263880 [Mycena capillaripes]